MLSFHAPRRSPDGSRPTGLLLRMTGLALLGCGGVAMRDLVRQVHHPFPHPITPGEFAVACVVVACVWAGLALAIAGAGLFHLLPLPPRAFL